MINVEERIALKVLSRRYPLEAVCVTKAKQAVRLLDERLLSLGKDHPNYKTVAIRRADIARLALLLTRNTKIEEPA